ncbi:MAG: DUF3566 domain-containing protein [Candidatus Nanopelagicales bacterium]
MSSTTGAPTPIGRTLEEAGSVGARDATPAVGMPVVPPAPTPEPPRYEEPAAQRDPRRNDAGPRRARLYLYKVDSWSIVKVAFMLAVAFAVVIVAAFAAIWYLLDYAGVFATLARNVNEVVGSGTTTFDVEAVLAFDRVMGIAVVVAAMEIALVSILAGIFTILYNITVGITGGIELTFTDSV